MTRVAATLLRNLERDIRRDLMREARQQPSDVVMDEIPDTTVCSHGEVPGLSADDLARALHERLGRDGVLVAAVVLDGFTQKEAGDLLGLTHDAARKRYQRALQKLRDGGDTL